MRTRFVLAAIVAVLVTGCAAPAPGAPTAAPARAAPAPAAAAPGQAAAADAVAPIPRPAHLVIVIFENKRRTFVLGNRSAPYLTALAAQGATMTRSYAITHPSQPNYLALFSGSTQGVTTNGCPKTFPRRPNLGQQLLATRRTFVGYAESMPRDGYTGCTGSNGRYARKHNPWVDFPTVPASANRTFARFPANFAALPTVSIVVPDMCKSMHDCSVRTGDAWARKYLDAYARWAKTHNSVLLVTFDEDDHGKRDPITTFFVGQHVKRGVFTQPIDHYTVLRTVEQMYGLPALGMAARRTPLTGIWTP
jgi:acid phosphatase